MKLYHARFVGNRIVGPEPFAREYQLIVKADSIHNVKSRIEDRYKVVSSFCASDLEATGLDDYLFEIN